MRRNLCKCFIKSYEYRSSSTEFECKICFVCQMEFLKKLYFVKLLEGLNSKRQSKVMTLYLWNQSSVMEIVSEAWLCWIVEINDNDHWIWLSTLLQIKVEIVIVAKVDLLNTKKSWLT